MFNKRGLKVKWSPQISLNPFSKRKKVLGQKGEDLAVSFLKGEGFKILGRNFRTRHGEIDIVALKRKEYFFIEVKTRENLDYGTPLESLPFFRIRRLHKMALWYATKYQLFEKHLHLSLLGIDLSCKKPVFTFIKDVVD